MTQKLYCTFESNHIKYSSDFTNGVYLTGHDQLLEICLLEKTGQHNFSFARHHSSKCHFFGQLVKN
jgi:hypothetical protein